MVFAVNPNAAHTFAAFQQKAMNASSTDGGNSTAAPGPSGPSGSSTGAPAPTTSTNTTNAATSLHAGAAGMLLGGISLIALVL